MSFHHGTRTTSTFALCLVAACTLIALGQLTTPANLLAQTILKQAYVSPDDFFILGTEGVDDQEVAVDDLEQMMVIEVLDLGVPGINDVKGFHLEDPTDPENSLRLFTLDDFATLGPADEPVTPRDVVEFDPDMDNLAPYVVRFNATDEGVTSGSTFKIDAVTRSSDGDLVLSFDSAVTFAPGSPSTSAEAINLSQFVGDEQFELFFDALASGVVVPSGTDLNLDAAHVTDGNRLIVSFSSAGQVGVGTETIRFEAADLVEFEIVDDSEARWRAVSLPYDGSERYEAGWGTRNLDAALAIPEEGCGNGIVETGEECDNTSECCTDDCQEVMDGVMCTQPDDTMGVCAMGECVDKPLCGNGVVDSGEQCDDGNTADGDCCSATCTIEMGCVCQPNVAPSCCSLCGDDERQCGEECDGTDADMCSMDETCSTQCECVPQECGNGVIDSGEQCDDGNTADGDCCSATCTIETGCVCQPNVAPSCCSLCGDDERQCGEECDGTDADMCSSGESCSNTCECVSEPEECGTENCECPDKPQGEPQCATLDGDCNGNGIIDAGDPICTMNCYILKHVPNGGVAFPATITDPCANPCTDCNCMDECDKDNPDPDCLDDPLRHIDIGDAICVVKRLIDCFQSCDASSSGTSALRYGYTAASGPRVQATAIRATKKRRRTYAMLWLKGQGAEDAASLRVELSANAKIGKIKLSRRARTAGFSIYSGRDADDRAVLLVVPPLGGGSVPAIGKGRLARVRMSPDATELKVSAGEFASTLGLPMP